ncbi:unnamed protein product [Ixodes hexagonus]
MSSKRRQTFDVFVGNLPHDIDEKTLSPLFTEVGEVSSIRIRNSRKPDGSKLAYVKYFFEPDAEAAVAQRNGYAFGNSTLVVYRVDGSSQRQHTPEPVMADTKEGDSKRKVLSALLAQNKKPAQAGPAPYLPVGLGGADEQMVVCEVRDVTSFFAQRMVDATRAVQLSSQLAEYCPKARPLEDSPEFRKARGPSSSTYAAKYSKDQLWYRCRILQKVDTSRSLVQYVDYGNCEHVADSTLVLLTGELAELPPLALHCRLDGLVGVRRDEDPQLYSQAMSHMQNLLRDELVLVQRKKVTAATTHFLTRCRVATTGIDLAQELLTKGYAKCHSALNQAFSHWEGSASRGMAPRPPVGAAPPGAWPGNPWRAPSRPHDPRLQDDSRCRIQGNPRMGLWYPDQDPRAHEPRGQDVRIPDLRMQAPRGQDFRSLDPRIPDLRMQAPRGHDMRGPDPREVRKALLPEQAALVRKLTAERDSLKAQLLKIQSRVWALELQVAEQGPKRPNLDFLARLSQVLESVEESRLQRERFSIGDSEDILERALAALGSCPAGKVPSSKLGMAQDRYKQSQDAIRACPDTALLEPLRLERDAARLELLQELQAGLEALDPDVQQGYMQQITVGAPCSRRSLMALERELNRNPARPLSPQCARDSGDGVRVERCRKPQSVSFFKIKTRTQAKSVFCSLLYNSVAVKPSSFMRRHLVQAVQFGTAIPGPEGRLFSLGYLEACLSNLHHSIQAELAACKLVGPSLSLSLPLAQLVWRVHGLLAGCLESASTASAARSQHTALLEELRPLDWDTSQSMAQAATEARRSLRKLKSRLRHRLADLEDLESGDEEERQRVTEEVAKLRQEVQLALSQEEPLLDRLAREHCKHFPELDKLFPDLQLDLHKRHAGLVKSNWELSSFELEGSTLQTKFLGKEMLLRECAIDSAETKELLLARAASYARASCKHLLSIRAVFPSKNERHIYLLVPRPAPSLLEQRCAPCHAQKALEHVLQALHALHSAAEGAICHGAVHPETVLFDVQAEEATLDLPLWAFRSGRGLLPTLDGIDFVAPELRGGAFCQPSPAGDMYSLGCLALWMLFPGTSFRQTPAGIPDTSVLESLQMGQPELSTIRRLLKAEPQGRLTAKEALASTFFLGAPHKSEPPRDASPTAETNHLDASSEETPQDTVMDSQVLLRAIEDVALTTCEGSPSDVSQDALPAVQHNAPEALISSIPGDLPPELPQSVLEATTQDVPASTDKGISQDSPQVEPEGQLSQDIALDVYENEMVDNPQDVPVATLPRLTVAQVLSIAASTKSKQDPKECNNMAEETEDGVFRLADSGDCSQPVEQMPEAYEYDAVGDQVDGMSSPPLDPDKDQESANESGK